jgi:hypothetical protein
MHQLAECVSYEIIFYGKLTSRTPVPGFFFVQIKLNF